MGSHRAGTTCAWKPLTSGSIWLYPLRGPVLVADALIVISVLRNLGTDRQPSCSLPSRPAGVIRGVQALVARLSVRIVPWKPKITSRRSTPTCGAASPQFDVMHDSETRRSAAAALRCRMSGQPVSKMGATAVTHLMDLTESAP